MNDKTRTITLTGRRPVRIHEDEWPTIAEGTWSRHDGEVRCQANRTWTIAIRVRRHDDGRAVVYGVFEFDTLCRHEHAELARVGVLLAPGDDLVSAIHLVTEQLMDRVPDDDRFGAHLPHPHATIQQVCEQCIADLPAEEI